MNNDRKQSVVWSKTMPRLHNKLLSLQHGWREICLPYFLNLEVLERFSCTIFCSLPSTKILFLSTRISLPS